MAIASLGRPPPINLAWGAPAPANSSIPGRGLLLPLLGLPNWFILEALHMLLEYLRAFKDGEIVRTMHHSRSTGIRLQSGGKAALRLWITDDGYFSRHNFPPAVNGWGRSMEDIHLLRARGKGWRGLSYIFVKQGNAYVLRRNNIFISDGPNGPPRREIQKHGHQNILASPLSTTIQGCSGRRPHLLSSGCDFGYAYARQEQSGGRRRRRRAFPCTKEQRLQGRSLEA